jgi:hypothetical protein
MERDYHEVWNSLDYQLKWTRWMSLGLMILLLTGMIAFAKLWQQRIVVVRLGEEGTVKALWRNPTSAKPSKDEAMSFAEEFLTSYLAPDSDKIEGNLKRALGMMDDKLRGKQQDGSKLVNYVQNVKRMNVETELKFKNVVAEEETGNFKVFLNGVQRTVQGHNKAMFHDFSSLVQLRPIERTEFNPYGLEVSYVDFDVRGNQ